MFVFNKEVIARNCEPGVTRKILSYTEDLMMCEITFEKGACSDIHSHPHLQITYIVKGRFEFTIDGEKKRVSAGDSLYMPANSIHGTVAIEEGMLVDVFSPMREDFLMG
ncbi:MAG: cupin domain-containing protein [Herbinix sp.]|nr:cupin domain-containing protein [Herbinix sp.]